MSERDKLLLEIDGLLRKVDWFQGKWLSFDRKDRHYIIRQILAKAKQHYEQELAMLDLCGCGHPFEEHDWGAYSKGEATCLVEKCDCPNFTRKRWDRPELREIRELLIDIYEFAKMHKGLNAVASKGYFDRKVKQLLALIPDIEEIKMYYKEMVGSQTLLIDELEAKVEEAKKQVVDFIESYLVTTIEPDGTEMHHIDDREWQSVKQRILRQALKEKK